MYYSKMVVVLRGFLNCGRSCASGLLGGAAGVGAGSLSTGFLLPPAASAANSPTPLLSLRASAAGLSLLSLPLLSLLLLSLLLRLCVAAGLPPLLSMSAAAAGLLLLLLSLRAVAAAAGLLLLLLLLCAGSLPLLLGVSL